MIIPIFYVTSKVAKDFGWDVYKKIGGSIKVQEMYVTVEWFSLWLKIDMFFEIFAYALYLYSMNYLTEKRYTIPVMVATFILIIPSFILSRYAISMENKIMMILFIIFQLWFTICTIFILATKNKGLMTDWHAITAYCIGSIMSSIGTIIIAIRCLLNFNKGLKEFVQWRLFGKKRPKRQLTAYDNVSQTGLLHEFERIKRVDTPIDDE
ncbi:hypothetical protein BD770DRAFT_447093 [Pilaira anomala]|nr:hypothetical protein BD770DRAFT_447093 [Pilaira anomala]